MSDGSSSTRSCSTSCARRRSRSPTGCSAASPRPRTSSRRRCCASTARSRRGERIESPRAFVATVTTRLAIDELRSARARRERYVGEWLPEPILTDSRDDPAPPGRDGGLAVAGACSCCSRPCLPSSAPCCCCATCSTTATTRSPRIVGKSEDNVRQLASRARTHVERAAAALSDLARAARRARAPVLRGGRAGRPGRARGAARPRRRAAPATAAARCRRWPGHCAAATASRGR